MENLPSQTTDEQNLVTKGQRRINIIWESTQAIVAVAITFAIIYGSLLRISSAEISNAFFLIIGFYFSRTNHAQIGGIGTQESQPYIGR